MTMRFGGVVAINALELTIHEGEIFALIGPNGAGKTTVFNLVTGLFYPSEGRCFNGGRIDGKKRFVVTKLGIARTFQNVRLFHNVCAGERARRCRCAPSHRPRWRRSGPAMAQTGGARGSGKGP